jgi:hypothetical protein
VACDGQQVILDASQLAVQHADVLRPAPGTLQEDSTLRPARPSACPYSDARWPAGGFPGARQLAVQHAEVRRPSHESMRDNILEPLAPCACP